MFRVTLLILIFTFSSQICSAKETPVTEVDREKAVSYFHLKTGVSFFQDDLKDLAMDTGFYSEWIYGYRFATDWAVEGGIGYFHDGDSSHGVRSDMRGIPVVVTVKRFLSFDDFELYTGIGAGVYTTKLKHEVNGVHISNDRDTVAGGHVVIGANLDLGSMFVIGWEGKYITTEEANFGGVRADLGQFVSLLSLGLRF